MIARCGICGRRTRKLYGGNGQFVAQCRDCWLEIAEARPDHVGAHRDNPGPQPKAKGSNPKPAGVQAPRGGTG